MNIWLGLWIMWTVIKAEKKNSKVWASFFMVPSGLLMHNNVVLFVSPLLSFSIVQTFPVVGVVICGALMASSVCTLWRQQCMGGAWWRVVAHFLQQTLFMASTLFPVCWWCLWRFLHGFFDFMVEIHVYIWLFLKSVLGIWWLCDLAAASICFHLVIWSLHFWCYFF